MGFPGGASGKEPTSQCWRCWRQEFNPWVRKIPWRRAWQTHSSVLAWEIPWTEEPGRLQSTGRRESDTAERLTLSHHAQKRAGLAGGWRSGFTGADVHRMLTALSCRLCARPSGCASIPRDAVGCGMVQYGEGG